MEKRLDISEIVTMIQNEPISPMLFEDLHEEEDSLFLEINDLLTCEALCYLAEIKGIAIPPRSLKNDIARSVIGRIPREIIQEYINQFRYAGDVSVKWFKLQSGCLNWESVKGILQGNVHESLFEEYYQPDLTESFQLVHAKEVQEGILLKFGMKNPVHYYFDGYVRKRITPSTFVYALMRPNQQLIEIRSNHSNCQKIRRIITDSLRVGYSALNPLEILSDNHAVEQIWNILDARLYWSKERNDDDADIEIESHGLNKFNRKNIRDMRKSTDYEEHRYKEGLQKRAKFIWNGPNYRSSDIGLGVDQRHASIKFYTHVPEEVIEHVLNVVRSIATSTL